MASVSVYSFSRVELEVVICLYQIVFIGIEGGGGGNIDGLPTLKFKTVALRLQVSRISGEEWGLESHFCRRTFTVELVMDRRHFEAD